MKIVFISDIHTKFQNIKIPKCDILISCGDYSFMGRIDEVRSFHEWMNKQKAKHKISVQGNHELEVEENFQISKLIAEEACPGVHFIDEGLVEIKGLKIWCSAITPFFRDWAWNRHSHEIQKHWDVIPEGIDILVTHGPPYGIADIAPIGGHIGCPKLLEAVRRVKPRIHAFGHIHEGYGDHGLSLGTHFINAAICDGQYRPINKPIMVKL